MCLHGTGDRRRIAPRKRTLWNKCTTGREIWTVLTTVLRRRGVRMVRNYCISKTVLALIHWGRAVHICVSIVGHIGSVNGLPPGRRQSIIWTNFRILLIWTLGTNLSEILSNIHIFLFKKMHLKMLAVKWRSFCLDLNVLIQWNCNIWMLEYIAGYLKIV